jgi:hypothetical protein
MLSFVIFYCYAECHYAEFRYAECRGAKRTTALRRHKISLGVSNSKAQGLILASVIAQLVEHLRSITMAQCYKTKAGAYPSEAPRRCSFLV